jgi:fused signal recognition particle receptor
VELWIVLVLVGLLLAGGVVGYLVTTAKRRVPLEPPSAPDPAPITRDPATPRDSSWDKARRGPGTTSSGSGTAASKPAVAKPPVSNPVTEKSAPATPAAVAPTVEQPVEPAASTPVEAPSDVAQAPGLVNAPEIHPEAQPEPVVTTQTEAEPEPDVVETEPEPEPEPVLVEPEPVRAPRFFDRLGRARTLLAGYFGGILGRSAIDDDTWEELEEALLRADIGVNTTQALLTDLKGRVKAEAITTPDALLDALKTDLKKRLIQGDASLRFEPNVPNVWLFVGVNGVGKTTTIGKVAKRELANGRTVLMAAGDTFRAAAAEQLGMWAERTGSELVRGAEGGDPASVIFDGIERAAARNINIVLADTAGRLQTKTNLMEELKKIRRVAEKGAGQVTEVLLVLDATTGQNGLSQAIQFREAAMLTGVVLTKLDGTAKGGIAVAIQTELGIPIKLVGLGEGVDDLVTFDAEEYVEALFANE